MITLKNIVKTYTDANESRTILDGLSVDIEQGESLSIQGASGCGKSSLLHIIAALDKPDSGEILLRQNEAQSLASNFVDTNICDFSEHLADLYRQSVVGLIFQKYNLIDCISVKDNIFLPAKINQNVDENYIQALMQRLDINLHANKLPDQLSGGEQQRVAIARSLSHKPSILLADEPTGNLDPKNAQQVSQLLIDTCLSLDTTLIVVTHSDKVARLCQRHFCIEDGQLVPV